MVSFSSMDTAQYLIRHGFVDNPNNIIYGRTDLPLSLEGRYQITFLADQLFQQGIIPDAIWSSPLKRTDETAQIIAKVYGISDITYREGLQEVDFGEEIVGRPYEFFAEVNGDVFTHNIPGKPKSEETPEQFTQRTLDVLTEINKTHRGKTIFVVGHGDLFSFALRALKHPKDVLPVVTYLEKNNMYLEKGDAGQVIFDEKNSAKKIDFVRLRDGKIRIEGYPEDRDFNLRRRI